jgi:hypothetical protein
MKETFPVFWESNSRFTEKSGPQTAFSRAAPKPRRALRGTLKNETPVRPYQRQIRSGKKRLNLKPPSQKFGFETAPVFKLI